MGGGLALAETFTSASRACHGSRCQRHRHPWGLRPHRHLLHLFRLPEALVAPFRVMELPVIHVFTHDSFSVGEDGFTISPSSRSPCCAPCPRSPSALPMPARRRRRQRGIERLDGPTVLLLTRQKLTSPRPELSSRPRRAAQRRLRAEGGGRRRRPEINPHRHRSEVGVVPAAQGFPRSRPCSARW